MFSILSLKKSLYQILKPILKVVNAQVETAGLPRGICLARSSLDGYCPPNQVEFIQTEVLKSLNSLFQTKNAELSITKSY